MRRIGLLAGCLGIVTLLAVGRWGPPVVAQTATPAALVGASGVTQAPIADGIVSALPPGGGIASLTQYRFVPGGTATIGPDAPSLLVIAVESGELSVETRGVATVQRAPAGNASPRTEAVAAGGAVRLGPGDSLVGLSPAGSVLRNDGTADAVVLSVGVRAAATAALPAPAASPIASNGLALALAVVIPPPCPVGTHLGSTSPAATPGGGGGGGGGGGVAMALAAAPSCVSGEATP
ncbi:MAG TPA: hypothetical protein VFU81_08485, partial [Thermomicrobiales bacterium]|nr:hypothetical protein [Thermomicrobiales bacterium]